MTARNYFAKIKEDLDAKQFLSAMETFNSQFSIIDDDRFFELKIRINSVRSRFLSNIITKTEYNNDLSKVDNIFTDLLLEIPIDLEYESEDYQQELNLEVELDDLKSYFNNIINLLNIRSSVSIVSEFIGNVFFEKRLKGYISKVNENEWKLNRMINRSNLELSSVGSWINRNSQEDINELYRKQNIIIDKIRNEIISVKEEDLKYLWKSIFTDRQHEYSKGDLNLDHDQLLISTDRVIIPADLSKGKKNEYRLKMIKAQDAYYANDYNQCYEICQDIKNRIEAESPQLYEYLFASYSNLIGIDALVDDYLNNNGNRNNINNLFVFAVRFNSLQYSKGVISKVKGDKSYNDKSKRLASIEDKLSSSTGYEVLKDISNNILLTIADRYTKIVSETDLDEFVKFKKLRYCITLSQEISLKLISDENFTLTLLVELYGGGSTNWLYVNKNNKIKEVRVDIDIDSEAEILIRMLSKGRVEKQQKLLDKIGRLVFNRHVQRLSNLKSLKNSKSVKKKKLIDILIGMRLASLKFPTVNPRSQMVIDQLSSNEKIAEWYYLDVNGNLKIYDEYKFTLDFHPLEYLRHYCKLNPLSNYDSIVSEIKYQIYIERTENAYTLNMYPGIYNKLNDLSTDFINQRIAALEEYKELYMVYNDDKFVVDIYRELIGDNNVLYFDFKENLTGALLDNQVNSIQKLKKLVASCLPNYNSNKEKEFITTNYYFKFFKSKINSSLTEVVGDYDKIPNLLEVVSEALGIAHIIDDNNEIIDFIDNELFCSNSLFLFDIQDGEIINSIYVKNLYKNRLLNLVDQFLEVISGSRDENLHKIKLKIVIPKIREIRDDYEKMLYVDYKNIDKNKVALKVVKFIVKLVDYHKATGYNPALEIPYNEIVARKGLVKWLTLGLLLNKSFPYLHLDYCKVVSRINGIRAFDFWDNYDYIETNYIKQSINSESLVENYEYEQ